MLLLAFDVNMRTMQSWKGRDKLSFTNAPVLSSDRRRTGAEDDFLVKCC